MTRDMDRGRRVATWNLLKFSVLTTSWRTVATQLHGVVALEPWQRSVHVSMISYFPRSSVRRWAPCDITSKPSPISSQISPLGGLLQHGYPGFSAPFLVTKKGLLVDQIAARRYSRRRREIHSWLLPTHDNLTGRWFIPSFGIWRWKGNEREMMEWSGSGSRLGPRMITNSWENEELWKSGHSLVGFGSYEAFEMQL